jgi:hypothetical protein
MSIEERAELIIRMVGYILYALKTQSYEQFAASFSNLGRPPNALEQSSRKLRFQMRISPTCWYNATASYKENETPSASIEGRGDDLGVCIIVGADRDMVKMELQLPLGRVLGCDAKAMARKLAAAPGWSS